MCRLFAAIKADLLSFCSGTGSLHADCSGWALLQHMLPLLPELAGSKHPVACIHNVACDCAAEIPLEVSLFEDTGIPVLQLRDVCLTLLRTLPPEEQQLKSESTSAMSLACIAALASRTLQDRVNSTSPLHITITPVSSFDTGMRGAAAADHDFIAREEERAAIFGAVASVMDGTSREARRVLLLYGSPGLGKSLLATQALRNAQKIHEKTHASQDVRVEIVRGRGAGVVEEDLVALGRSLGGAIGVESASPQDVVLAALQHFLGKSRYVLLIDDADAEGLARAFQCLPVSEQRCALIITSQSLTHDAVKQLLVEAGDDTPLHFHKELQPFTHEECMVLMTKICDKCEPLLKKVDELRAVFGKGLRHLPLAVRLFAEWSREQFNACMRQHADDMQVKMQAACKAAKESAEKARQPYDREQAEAQFRCDYDAATGYGSAAADDLLQQWSSEMEADEMHSQGLLGTVRLALLQLDALSPDMKEACEQLLGLLALCPPVQVPWSLFDGVSLVSAIDQACKVRRDDGSGGVVLDDAVVASDEVHGENVCVRVQGNKQLVVPRSSVSFGPHILGMIVKDKRYQVQLVTPQPNMRGAIVEVTGESLEFVCPTGEPCLVAKTGADEEPVTHRAVVASDRVFKGGESICVQLRDGTKEFVTRSGVSFGPHVAGLVVQDGRYMLQLQQFRPAGGNVHITIDQKYREKDKRGKRALLISNYIVDDRIRVRLCDGSSNSEVLLLRKHAEFPDHVRVVNSQLVLDPAFPATPSPPPQPIGRVVKYYRASPLKDDPDNDTVSVVFGCETGERLLRHSRIRFL